jgi:hypothetical protein
MASETAVHENVGRCDVVFAGEAAMVGAASCVPVRRKNGSRPSDRNDKSMSLRRRFRSPCQPDSLTTMTFRTQFHQSHKDCELLPDWWL